MTRELVDRGVAVEKIKIMPRGVDVDRFHPRFRRENINLPEGPRLLYVGRVSREKNLPLLVRAFKKARHQLRAHLVVVGDGPYLGRMKAELSEDEATFTHFLRGDALSSVYASCDLFVFPSATDTFGNVVLEAQASGLPVLVSDQGGPRENLLPGETGMVVPANDETAFAEAMVAMLSDQGRLRQMADKASEYAKTRSYARAFDDYWRMYPDGRGLEVELPEVEKEIGKMLAAPSRMVSGMITGR